MKDSKSNSNATGELERKIKINTTTPSVTITIMDWKEQMDAQVRIGEVIDEIVVSKAFSKLAVLNALVKLEKSNLIQLQVTLMCDSNVKRFRCSPTQIVPVPSIISLLLHGLSQYATYLQRTGQLIGMKGPTHMTTNTTTPLERCKCHARTTQRCSKCD